VCVCNFLYVFAFLNPKRQKELNVLIVYDQVSQKYKKWYKYFTLKYKVLIKFLSLLKSSLIDISHKIMLIFGNTL
jgi:hypothetical protein